jgi:hypothetical protein
MNKGLEIEAIIEKEKRDKLEQEMSRARKATETIKRLRLEEGPEVASVLTISKRVDFVVSEKEKAKVPMSLQQFDPVDDEVN